MRKTAFFLSLSAMAGIWSGCSVAPTPGNNTPQAVPWEGELRILPGDTLFIPCGKLTRYRVAGPALDSLAHRYAWLRTVDGQWMKTWLDGYLSATPGGTDSLLVATAYMHMDAEVNCPPVPVDSMAGSYSAQAGVPGGWHTERLEFLPGGEALIITSTPAVYAEVEGRWGLDSDGDVVFVEEQGRYSFYYGWDGSHLKRPLPRQGSEVVYKRDGEARRLAGAYGRVARWLAAIADANGQPFHAEDLRPAMRLDSLLAQPAMEALRAEAPDTLGLTAAQMATTWKAAETVRDVTRLMRTHLRAAR